MKNFIKLIRPKHYFKNLFILLPLFFSGQINNLELLLDGLVAFIAFSLVASSIYIFNDYKDIYNDRKHPIKKFRPLASGLIKKSTALNLMVIFLISGSILMYFLSFKSFIVLTIYILLNFAYSLKLKQIALLDVTIIASGFVLRIFTGSFAYEVPLTIWIVIMTFLIALFLALAKRRDDVLILNKSGKKTRKSIDGYNLKLIDGIMIMMSAVVIVAYIQITITEDFMLKFESENLYLTGLFVIFGIMRYLQITIVEEKSGSPTEIIYTDKILQISILLWILMFSWFIYI
mgnify:FL=1